jgi:DNA-binding PadR family transcriptional regulator
MRTLHGYGIWKALKEEHSLEISVPSVYQHLSELVSLNLLNKGEARRVIGERKRRYYQLNEKGKKVIGLEQ